MVKKARTQKIHIDMKVIISLILFLTIFHVNGQRVLLLNGLLHVGNGSVVETSAIGIQDGKILFVKNALTSNFDQTQWDTIIKLDGQQIYPGFVATNSTLGLNEIDAVRATRDFQDVGEFNPHVRAQIAYMVESRVIETVKSNGILITQTTPRGGIISGTSSLMFLDGWNWEDATLLKDDGVHLNWPEANNGDSWNSEVNSKNKNKDYKSQCAEIFDFFQMASVYAKDKKPTNFDQRLEAMVDCFKGTKRVFIHASELQQLTDIISFVSEFKIPFPVIVGGHDAYLLGARLKDAQIPVMLQRVHSLPNSEDENVALPYQLASLLQKEEILFCLQNEGDMEAMNTRNLPFQAGTAMAYGLTEEQAVRSISLSACEILGIDQNYGSIETGKSATLFVSKGSALDMRSNQVTLIIRDGQLVDHHNFQEKLYLKYKKKYEEKP